MSTAFSPMFRATERQLAALAAMETFAGIRSQRTEFADAQQFQDYWKLVSQRADRAAHTRATATPASQAEHRRAERARTAAWYADPTHLANYGRAYAQRFQPSLEKLRQRLALMCSDTTVIATAMEQLTTLCDDQRRAQEVAEMMQRQGRHAQAIRARLRQRLFANDTIDATIRSLTTVDGSTLDPEALARKARSLQRKGLSQRAIRLRLQGQPGDEQAVSDALRNGSDDLAALQIAIARLNRRQLDRAALTQRLIARGFRYADIQRALISG